MSYGPLQSSIDPFDSEPHMAHTTYQSVPSLSDRPGRGVSHESVIEMKTFNSQSSLYRVTVRDPDVDSLDETMLNKTHQPDVVTDRSTVWMGKSRWNLIPDLLWLLLPIMFFGELQERPESPWASKVVLASTIAPSIWPLIFSAIVGGTLKAFADWKVERGLSLGTLEQIMGSRTLANTFVTSFNMRVFGLPTILLIALWSFNPLGSQASFRSVYLEQRSDTGTGTINYYSHNFTEQGSSGLEGSSSWNSMRSQIRAIYNSALFDLSSGLQFSKNTSDDYELILARLGGMDAAIARGSMDPWGNVRTPSLRRVPGYDPDDPERWLDVPPEQTTIGAASLIGSVVRGIPLDFTGSTAFTMGTNYHEFSCTSGDLLTQQTMPDWMEANYKNMMFHYNKSLDISQPNAFLTLLPSGSGGISTFFIDLLRENSSTQWPQPPRTLMFGSRASDDGNYFVTNCKEHLVYVDVNVTCASNGPSSRAQCNVFGIRQMPAALQPDLRADAFSSIMLYNKLEMLDPSGHPGQASLTELFMQDPPRFFVNGGNFIGIASNISNLSADVFSDRWTLMFNTIYDASRHLTATIGGDIYDVSEAKIKNVTSATQFPIASVYVINVPWMVVYFVSSTIMLSAAVITIAFRALCRAPEILGFVSSLTRDSPYFRDWGAETNSTDSGTRRARRLGMVKVMVGDANPGGDVGRMSFIPATDPSRLKVARPYD
ncbi:hypothetical protein JX266_012170 [Neoarthrinium moseri]|nr:hypothetical protein JX266_012170 [Neoarthrinium moseri]